MHMPAKTIRSRRRLGKVSWGHLGTRKVTRGQPIIPRWQLTSTGAAPLRRTTTPAGDTPWPGHVMSCRDRPRHYWLSHREPHAPETSSERRRKQARRRPALRIGGRRAVVTPCRGDNDRRSSTSDDQSKWATARRCCTSPQRSRCIAWRERHMRASRKQQQQCLTVSSKM